MKTQIAEVKAFPASDHFSEIDRLMFGPVDPLVKTNKRLSLALVAMGLTAGLSMLGNGVQYYQASTKPVRVLSINEAGHVESLSLRLTGFNLHRTETQAALHNAVNAWAEKFYSRVRNPLNGEVASRAYFDGFLFMSRELSDAYKQLEMQQHNISAFMSSAEPEYRVVVTNVVFRNLDKKPYEADLYFDKVYYSQPLTVSAKKSYFASIQFTANPADEEIENLRKRSGLDIDAVLKMNPLVLTVTRIGDEQPFTASPGTQQ